MSKKVVRRPVQQRTPKQQAKPVAEATISQGQLDQLLRLLTPLVQQPPPPPPPPQPIKQAGRRRGRSREVREEPLSNFGSMPSAAPLLDPPVAPNDDPTIEHLNGMELRGLEEMTGLPSVNNEYVPSNFYAKADHAYKMAEVALQTMKRHEAILQQLAARIR